jgi:hypothetical protein
LAQRLCDLSNDLVGVRADSKVRWIRRHTDIVSYFDCIQELVSDGICPIWPLRGADFSCGGIASAGGSEVEVIQDLSSYPLYVDGGAAGWSDVIPFSNATPEVNDCITLRIAVEVVPKVVDAGAETGYPPSKPNIEAVKEAMVAIRGDVWIYVIACVIGEEGVSGEI